MKNFFDEQRAPLTILIMVLSFFLLIQSFAVINDVSIKKRSAMAVSTITGYGSADITAKPKPDIAYFFITVREEEKEVEKAQQKMTEKANKALQMLKEKGIDEKDIKTENYNTYPKYSYEPTVCFKPICPPAKQILTGYEASETIAVKLRKLETAGEIFSEAAKLAVGEVGGLSFAIEDQEKFKAKARAEAIEKAKKDAELTAKAVGVKLGRFVNFSENNSMPLMGVRSMTTKPLIAAQIMVPQIEAGEQKIVISVMVTYEIK